MPIKGFADQSPIPRVGKIYLGVKQESERTKKEYPVAVDHFVVRADDKATSEAAAEAFHQIYGEEPKAIKVMFPSDNPEHFFPQWLKAYRERSGKNQLYCKGDGETANRLTEEAGWVEMNCPYKECELYKANKCKELGQLQFFLPDVGILGVWQLDTTSFHSMSKLNGTINMIRQLNGGRIKMIPLTLRVVPMTVSPEGKAKTVYVLQLDVENVKLTDVMANRSLLAIDTAPIVAPIDQDELPVELYPPSKVIVDEGTESTTQPRTNVETLSKAETKTSSTRATLKVISQDDLADLSNVGALTDVVIRESKGTEFCKVCLAMADSGEVFETMTTNPDWVSSIRDLPVGTLLKFQTTTKENLSIPLLQDLAIVS